MTHAGHQTAIQNLKITKKNGRRTFFCRFFIKKGDYLFTDPDFIKNLSVTHRNVFQKIYDEIKYLYSVATAGSKEARQLARVKRAFEQAARQVLIRSILYQRISTAMCLLMSRTICLTETTARA